MDEDKVIKTINQLLDCIDGKSFGETEIVCILSMFVHAVLEAHNPDISSTFGKVTLGISAIEYKMYKEGGVENGDTREQEG